MAMPLHSKPAKSSWNGDEKIQQMIVSLQGYAMGDCKNEDQKKMAAKILKAMVLTKSAFSAANPLIDIGYFPVHVNLDLLKSNIPNYSDEIISAAESLMAESSDPDELGRIDLTHLKIYAIDVDEAKEVGWASCLLKGLGMRPSTSSHSTTTSVEAREHVKHLEQKIEEMAAQMTSMYQWIQRHGYDGPGGSSAQLMELLDVA